MKRKRLGEVLRERGQVSASDLSTALQEQQQNRVLHLGELLLHKHLVSKQDLTAALLEVSQIPYFDCSEARIEAHIVQLVPAAMAWRCRVLPVGLEDGALVVAMAEPQNLQQIDELRFKTGKAIAPRLAFRGEIDKAIEKYYGAAEPPAKVQTVTLVGSEPEGAIEFISSTEQKRNKEAMREMQAELTQKSKTTPAVMLVAEMIQEAVAKRASDIHIEPQTGDVAIRFRVDGLLREYQRASRALQNTVVSRIKILSDMDISERRAPQDGRFLVKLGKKHFDLRVSTLPTQYGEKVVMRLLDADTPMGSFSGLGIPTGIEEDLKRMLTLPQGMILVTGPTGSGKSTTLYSSLVFVRKPSVNVITVEDPVEYAIEGVNQVQVNTKAGVTFATSLRSILRQDPNVIMIGEIRDRETAEIALKAAQTGHLVLSTLHTNDSISAVTRLLDLGVPAFQVATSLTGIIAQRLIRRLCACHKTERATPEFVRELQRVGAKEIPVMQAIANGCEECGLTGFKGRIGIYEMLVLNEGVRTEIREGRSTDEIRTSARRNGMRLMQEFALDQICAGITTLEEIERVVPIERAKNAVCGGCQRELGGTFSFCPYCGATAGAAAERQTPHVSLPGRQAVHS